jgi:flagellar biosynthesis GTPase FlhF
MGFLGRKKKRGSSKDSAFSASASVSVSASASASASHSASMDIQNSVSDYKEMTDGDNNVTNTGTITNSRSSSGNSRGGVGVSLSKSGSRSSAQNIAQYEYALRQYSQTSLPGSNESNSYVSGINKKTKGKNKKKTTFKDIPPPPPPPPPPRIDTKTSARGSTEVNQFNANSLSYSTSHSPPHRPSQDLSQQQQWGDGSSSSFSDSSSDDSDNDAGSVRISNKSNDNQTPKKNNKKRQQQQQQQQQQQLQQQQLQQQHQIQSQNQRQNPQGQNQQQQKSLPLDSNNAAFNSNRSVATVSTAASAPGVPFIYSYPNYPGSPHRRHIADSNSASPNTNNNNNTRSNGGFTSTSSNETNHTTNTKDNHNYYYSPTNHNVSYPEPEMVDVTYEEKYGEAYVNKPIRYIYPSGYENIRPRSRPWQISIVFCVAFAFLNVFIVGHCSDRFDWDNYYIENGDDDANANANGDDANANGNRYYQGQIYDDAQMMIVTRWCGSKSLYFTWVLSVLITGLSCAYCSIVGYIKARDFSVANNRSQQPGMVGRSDYYVQIEEGLDCKGNKRFSSSSKGVEVPRSRGVGSDAGASSISGADSTYNSYQDDNKKGQLKSWYKKTIYQSDGTPRYFGGRIYRPTQAAVNITSR